MFGLENESKDKNCKKNKQGKSTSMDKRSHLDRVIQKPNVLGFLHPSRKDFSDAHYIRDLFRLLKLVIHVNKFAACKLLHG